MEEAAKKKREQKPGAVSVKTATKARRSAIRDSENNGTTRQQIQSLCDDGPELQLDGDQRGSIFSQLKLGAYAVVRYSSADNIMVATHLAIIIHNKIDIITYCNNTTS